MKLTYVIWFSTSLMVGCASTPFGHQDSYKLCQSLAYAYDEAVIQELEQRGLEGCLRLIKNAEMPNVKCSKKSRPGVFYGV